jgi:hypothetical protein
MIIVTLVASIIVAAASLDCNYYGLDWILILSAPGSVMVHVLS